MGVDRIRRLAAGGLAACLLAAVGCDSELAGAGEYAEGAGRATPPASGTSTPPEASTPAGTTPADTTAPPSPTAAPAPPPRTTPPGTIPAPWAGTWTGTMRQPTGVITSWTAIFVLKLGQRSGTFQVAPHCRGIFVVLATRNTRLELREVITSDPNSRCAASGTFVLQRSSATRARARWVDADHADNIAAGTLTRD